VISVHQRSSAAGLFLSGRDPQCGGAPLGQPIQHARLAGFHAVHRGFDEVRPTSARAVPRFATNPARHSVAAISRIASIIASLSA
jgi:hypothetical protein